MYEVMYEVMYERYGSSMNSGRLHEVYAARFMTAASRSSAMHVR